MIKAAITLVLLMMNFAWVSFALSLMNGNALVIVLGMLSLVWLAVADGVLLKLIWRVKQ